MFYLSKFCLLCLKEDNGKLHNVENKDSSDVSIQEKLDYCVFELISSGHEFPGYICEECLQFVEMFYGFKQKCFKNNRKIRNLMDSLKQMHFSGISFRDLSIPIKDIKNNITLPLKRKSINISKKPEIKALKNLIPESSKLNKSTGMFQCEDCPKQFHMKRQLVRHQATHTKTKYECEVCEKKFSRKGNLDFHKQVHKKAVKAEIKLNKSENDIKPKKSWNNSKPGNGMYECGICYKRIVFKHNLKRHFLKFHVESKMKKDIKLSYNIIAPEKQNIFNSTMNSIDLTDDSSISDNESDVEIISYNATDIIELKDELTEQYSDRQMYNEILQTNSKKLNQSNVTANNKVSVIKENVTKNDLKEAMEKNMQCFICDKTFSRNCKLNTHVKSHFEETPYKN